MILVTVTHDALEAFQESLHPIDRFTHPPSSRPNAMFQGDVLTVSELGDKKSHEAKEIRRRFGLWLEMPGYWRFPVEGETPDYQGKKWHEKTPYKGEI